MDDDGKEDGYVSEPSSFLNATDDRVSYLISKIFNLMSLIDRDY